MDTHAAGGNSADDTFILQQGGHTGVHADTEGHTQDFIVTGTHDFTLRANQLNATNNVAVSLDTLGTRITHASVWQAYRINSVTFLWYFGGAVPAFATEEGNQVEQIGDLVFSIAPYSRDPRLTTATFQAIDCRSVPGCQTKYLASRLYYPNIYADATSGTGPTPQAVVASNSFWQSAPQMCKSTNDCPMYEVQALTQTNTLGGQVYANGKLALLSAAGRDTTIWHAFLTRIDSFDPVGSDHVIRGNYIAKVNVTFEGIRWDPPSLYQPGGPGTISL